MEFVNSEQFLNGDIGFAIDIYDNVLSAGYDIRDEIKSKEGAIQLIEANKKSEKREIDDKSAYGDSESFDLITIIKNSKKENRDISPEEVDNWFYKRITWQRMPFYYFLVSKYLR